MRSFILLSIVLAVGGCATPAEREAKRVRAAASATFDQARQCLGEIGQSTEWQDLSAHLPPLDGSEPRMSLRTDSRVPTAAQAAQLVKLFNDRLLPCQTLVVSNLQAVHPSLAVAVAEFNAAANQAYARLVSRQLTWGAYASLSATLNAQARANWAKAGQKVADELEARLNAEDQRRRQALANAYNALALYQNQQLLDAANRPRTVNCTRMAGYFNCTQF
jgi:hypothetical protein